MEELKRINVVIQRQSGPVLDVSGHDFLGLPPAALMRQSEVTLKACGLATSVQGVFCETDREPEIRVWVTKVAQDDAAYWPQIHGIIDDVYARITSPNPI